ncbi:MAG: STAS domain-containing protein, partial [Caldilineae bacterium]
DAEYKNLDEASLQPYLNFFRNADALVFDAQYTLRDVWQLKEDWGHSSAMIGVDLARAAGVKRLLLFHHDPTATDARLMEIQQTAQAYQAQDPSLPTCEVLIAYEGLTLDLTPPGTVDVELSPTGEAAILIPTSIFDQRGVAQLEQQLARLSQEKSTSIPIVDLSQVETLTTASLKSLLSLHRQRHEAQIVLANPSPNVREIIKLSGYLDFFAIYPSVEAALDAIHVRQSLNLPGQLIKGRYRIESKLGGSLLGTVLKATDLQENRPVALKILSPSFSEETINRLMARTEQIIRLEHHNIVKVYCWDREEGYAFKVEEHIEAPTLQDCLTDPHFTPSPHQALDIALDITLALEYAHSRGVIHGDLKPQNVFLTEAGAKLSGFGMGILEAERKLLDAPLLFLSAPYLAPEQILGQAIDARTDLYALGVLMYQLFTGQLPFTGSDAEIMQAHLHQTPIPPRQINPNISLALEHLILKLLAKNPNDRYASAQQARRISGSLVINIEEPTLSRQPTLLGREKELQTLQTYWEKARAGQGQLLLLSGEPGIGKTTLAEHFAAHSNAPICLIGHGREETSTSPYQLFTEALHGYFATVPSETFAGENRLLISHFARLLPDAQALFPDLPAPPPLEPQQEQLRLMASLTQFIQQATAERPWLLLLDDLQWADQNSLELLRYLGRHVSSMALFIIAIHHDTDLPAGHPLRNTLREVNAYPAWHQMTLPRLGLPEVHQILVSLWGDNVPDALTEKIYQHTGGNPFYVKEVAKGLVDDELITLQDGIWHFPPVAEIRLPATVREAVWRRIRHLNPDTQTLLRQASVLGQTFQFEDLVAMSGLPEWEVLELLDPALERQLIHERPAENALRFSHAEIHYVLYADIGPLQRRRLHLQAGESLERRAMPEPERIAAELAHHFTEAGEFERALVYSVQAARQAEAAHANDTAIGWYRHTLALFDKLSPEERTPFQKMRIALYRGLGEMLAITGQYEEALAQYHAARTLLNGDALSPPQARLLAGLYRHIAEVYEKQGNYAHAFTWVQKGLDTLPAGSPDVETARLHLLGATLHYRQMHNAEALTWCQKSLAIAEALDSPEAQEVVGRACYRLGAIAARHGNLEREIAYCQQSLDIFRRLGHLSGQMDASNNLGIAYFEQGNWAEAEAAYHKSLGIARQIGNLYTQAFVSNNLALIPLARGNYEEALQLLEASRAIWQRIDLQWGEAVALTRQARVHLWLGNLQEAHNCLTQSEAIFDAAGYADEDVIEMERAWSKYHRLTGNLAEALRHARRAVQLAEAQENRLEEAISHRLVGEAHLAAGELRPAEAALRHSLQMLNNLHSDYQRARTQLLLARLLAQTGSTDEAHTLLTEAIALFETLDARPVLEEAQHLLQTWSQPDSPTS